MFIWMPTVCFSPNRITETSHDLRQVTNCSTSMLEAVEPSTFKLERVYVFKKYVQQR